MSNMGPYPAQVHGANLVDVKFSFAENTNAVTAAYGWGVTSITWVADGHYSIVMDKAYPALICSQVSVHTPITTGDLTAQHYELVYTASTGTAVLKLLDGANDIATSVPDDTRVNCTFTFAKYSTTGTGSITLA